MKKRQYNLIRKKQKQKPFYKNTHSEKRHHQKPIFFIIIHSKMANPTIVNTFF